MSIITVTSNANSGPGTLRNAIAAAAPGDTIIFAASLSGLTITLASTLEIAQDLTIDGSALSISITLSGNNAARIMRVGNNARVTLDSLILTRGRQDTPDCFWDEGDFACGGGLKVETGAVVTLTRSAVLDNWAWVIGGGVANYGEMRITDTAFAGNRAIYGGAILNLGVLQAVHSAFTNNATEGRGGAILNEGVLTVTQSVFTGNSADFDYGYGGAIASTGGALTVAQSVFTGNSANRGGAIVHTEGESSSGPVVIAFSAFTSNTAKSYGGAIVIHDGGRHSPRIIGQIADSTFSGNRALNAVPTLSPYGSGGGAIYASANLSILRSAFHGNVSSARGGALFSEGYELSTGGGLLTVTQSVFTDNLASQWGGAASLSGGALVQNCLFVGNQVTQTKAIPDFPMFYQGYGGGIYIDTSSSQSAQINNSTLSGNGAARQGGGLFVNKGTVHLTHVTVVDNGAPEGAGIYVGGQLGSTGVGTLYYTNTLVARNLLGNSGLRGDDCVVKAGSALGTNVNNLVEDGSCSADGVGFLSGDPLLSPLTDLGGPRVGVNQDVPLRIYGLRPGSPALDSAASGALTTDQRGFERPQAAASDRGAYEHGPLRLALTVAPATTMPLGGLVTYTLVLANDAAVPADVRLTVTLPAGLTFERWGEIPPDGTTSTFNGLHWRGSLPAASSLGWVFETRNTGAVNQPGEYGDALLTTAYVSGDTDPGNWTDLTVIVECDPDPLSVDNLHNAGPCSLRQTLADAPSGATITFRPELAGQTIWVAYPKPFSELPARNAMLTLDRDVTVDGSSLLMPITLDGNDESRLLLITNAANVTVNHLTLTHGRASAEESPTVCGVGVAGGAIKIVTGAALTLTRSSVINNTAMDSSGTLLDGNGVGGGIANLGRLTVLSSTIANNYAAGTYAGGGLINGAISSSAPMATAIIADSVITGNLAPRPDFAMGGGVMNCSGGTLTVTRSLIAGNRVSGAMGGGAGLANYEGTLVVSESAFVNNTTVDPPVASNYGGGILTSNSSIIQNSAFSGNQAGRGGAITAYDGLTLTHSTLAGNVATASDGAGGLDMRGTLDDMFYLQNNLIANNTAWGEAARSAR
jgi:hypothetical protein